MPQLDDLLAKAQNNETRKTFTRGNRPDRIASGQGLLPTADEKVGTPKVEPKWSQTEAKVEPEPEPKWSQTEAKVEPQKNQKIKSRAKVEPEPEPKVEPKWSQTEAKVEPKVRLTPHPSSVVGLQRKALLFLYESCRFLGSRITPPFAIQNIADGCKTSISAAKKAIQRLIEKKILLRAEYKDGRSGWTRYELPASIYNALLHEETGAKVESNWSQSRVKVGTKVEPEPEPNAPSSSSKDLDLNKLTNTARDEVSILPAEWGEIDTTPITEIRFGRNQLTQIFQIGKLTSEQVQESIYAFAFDLEVNGRKKEINGAALNYFMGILRKGPYAPPSNYEAPDVRQMRLYLEAKKREQQVRLDLESQLEEVEHDSWLACLSTEEKIKLVPPSDFAKPGSPGHNVQLKQYFRENIWPELREKVSRAPNKTT